MKRNRFVLWLFVIPFVLPVWLWSKAKLQSYAPPKTTLHDVGGFKTTIAGERTAMKKLAALIRSGQDKGKVGAIWNASRADPKLGIDLGALEFERVQKRFAKHEDASTKQHPWRFVVTQYTQVEPNAIIRIAAQNGIASDLLKHGAKLKRHGIVDLNANKELVLQW